MASFNFSTKQMAAKIVYYGPGLGGKTTSLKYIFEHTSSESRGKMVSLATETDRTLFFDLLPLEVGTVAGFKTRIQLYTVPGQVFYNSTRRLVLKGVDGVVFVADSQAAMLPANLESFRNLEVNLAELGISIEEIPLVLQYNKRDLEGVCTVQELSEALNRNGWPEFETSALEGAGVFEALRDVSRLTLLSLKKQLETTGAQARKPSPPPSAPKPKAARPKTAESVLAEAPATPDEPAQPATTAASKDRSGGYSGDGPPPWRGPSDPKETLAITREEFSAAESKLDASAEDLDSDTSAPPTTDPVEQTATTEAADGPADSALEAKPAEEDALEEVAESPPLSEAVAADAAKEWTNGHRELDRSLAFELERADLSRAKTVAFDLQIRDGQQRVLHQMRDVEIDLVDLEDLDSLRVQLEIALQARAED